MGYNRTLGHFTNSQELATVWASGQNYIVNQLVLDNNKLYRCITAHTSGATFAGDSANWAGLNPGATVAISEGGTGQTTKTDAFDALAPTTTAGDLIVYNGTDNVRLPVGTDGQMIVADASQANKLKWATVPQGSKNYITYSNFENNATTGWSLFNTTLDANKIPNGSIVAGAGSLNALAVSSSTPLAGSYSLSVTSPGAVAAGQGFITDPLTIDREDQAKVLTFSFYYETVSGTMDFSGTSANTWAIYIHDGTSWIQPAGVYGMTQSSGVGLVTGTFQTNATGTSYRLAVVCITATGAAISMKFDDFKLSPQTAPIGPVVTDWVQYTPTFTSWGTVSNVSVYSRRVGDSLEVEGRFQAGTTAAATAFMTLGFNGVNGNVTVDGAKLNGFYVVGSGAGQFSSATWFSSFKITTSGGAPSVGFGVESSTTPGYSGSFGTSFGNNGVYSFYLKVPISGWASQVQLSNDTDTRVVAFSAYDGGGVGVTNTTAILPMGNTEVDTHSVRSGNTYVVPVSGFYRLAAKSTSRFSVGNTTFNHALLFYKNGVVQNNGDYGNADGANSSGVEFFFLSINSIVRLNAGDVIDFRYFTNYTGVATTYLKYCSIERLSGPSVVAASETVAARYYKTATQTFSTETKLTGYTRVFDTHNAWDSSNNWYRFPVSGKYLIQIQNNGIAATTAAQVASYRINGVATPYYIGNDNGNTVGSRMGGCAIINVNAGDYIEIYHFTSASTTIQQTETNTNFSITRVGN